MKRATPMLEDTFLLRVFAAALSSPGRLPSMADRVPAAIAQCSDPAALGFYGQLMNLEIETLETQGFEIYNHGQTAGP
jgi:hypothetical protein